MSYSVPEVDPDFVRALMEQDDPKLVRDVLILYTMGLMQGVSSVLREHAMTLLLQGFQQEYVNGWLDCADTFDMDPPPRAQQCEEQQAED